jgi:alpha-tubulin suppressor-like RCC1 family protein
MVAASCSGLGALAGCEIVLGLPGETVLVEAGRDATPGDSRADSHRDAGPESDVDAAGPPKAGAAIAVASSSIASDWCVVTESGDVECWGNNESGELGDGTTKPSTAPAKVKGIVGRAVGVSLQATSPCALTGSGAVFCWGYGMDGELGNGTAPLFASTAVPVSGLGSGVTAISSGGFTSCAVQGGALRCWGYGGNGLLGTGQMSDAHSPVIVPGLETGVTAVSVGGNAACAVKDSGLQCWGALDGYGELGNNTVNGSYTPLPVPTLSSGVAEVSVGLDFACALTAFGSVECWGDGTRGQLGNGQQAVSPVPVQVQGLTSGVIALSAGAASACAIKGDGAVVCWGYAADGELGDGFAVADSGALGGSGGASTVPVRVVGLSGPAVAVATGEAPCVATRAGSVECWGIVAELALRPVSVTDVNVATSVTTGGSLTSGEFACAVDDTGQVGCWGGNGSGQLGDGTTTSGAIPVLNELLFTGSTAVSGGTNSDFACGVSSGLAYCWGDNHSGQLGNRSKVSSPTPVAVEGLTGTVTSVAAGGDFACAITNGGDAGPSGALHCWGNNTYGQLGNGTTTTSSSPVAVKGLASGVVAVSLGAESSCALLSDGTVDCWGNDSYGQLGDGKTATSLSPTPVTGLTGATALSVGWYSACAVTFGTVECWGGNVYGQIGDGSFMQTEVPVPVIGITGVASQVGVGESVACAVVGGGAQCWGYGPTGNDGAPGLYVPFPAPVVGLGSGVSSIAVGVDFACAVDFGRVDCWGLNSAGQLGNGGRMDGYFPAKVAGFPRGRR